MTALAFAACSTGGSSRPTVAEATTTTLGPTPTTRLMPTKPGGAPGPVVTVPTESGVRPISEVVDSGQQILIEPDSFFPRILIANVKVPITWTNLTNSPQQISFLSSTIRSPSIPPGGKWSYTPPTALNIHYVDRTLGLQATVDFNPAP